MFSISVHLGNCFLGFYVSCVENEIFQFFLNIDTERSFWKFDNQVMNLQIMSEKYHIISFTIINIIIFVFGLNKETVNVVGYCLWPEFCIKSFYTNFFPSFPVDNKTPSQGSIKHDHINTKSVFMLILGNFYNYYYLTFLGLPNQ